MANTFCTLTLTRSITLQELISNLGLTPDVFYSLGCNGNYYGIDLPIAAGNVITIPCKLASNASSLGLVNPMTIGNPCLVAPIQGFGTGFQAPASYQTPFMGQTSNFQSPSSFQTPSTGLSNNFQSPSSFLTSSTANFQSPSSFQPSSTANFQSPSSFQTPSGLSNNFQSPSSFLTSSTANFQSPSSFQPSTGLTGNFQSPYQQAITDFQYFESQGLPPCQSMIDAIAEILGADVTGITITVGPSSLIDSDTQWILRIDSRYPMKLTQIEAKLADLGAFPIKVVPSDRTRSTSALVYSLGDIQKAFTTVSSVGNSITPCAQTANSLQFGG